MLWNQSHNAVQNTSVVHGDGEPWEHFSLTLPLQRLWSTALHSVPAQCSDTEPPMLTLACFWACLSHDNVWIGFRFLFSSPLSLSSNQVLAAHLWARGRGLGERWQAALTPTVPMGGGAEALTLLLPQKKGQQEKGGWNQLANGLYPGKIITEGPSEAPYPLNPSHTPQRAMQSFREPYNHSITFWKGSLKDHIFFQSQRTHVRGVSLCQHAGSTTGKHLWSLLPVSQTVQTVTLQLLKSVCHKKQLHLKNASVIIY